MSKELTLSLSGFLILGMLVVAYLTMGGSTVMSAKTERSVFAECSGMQNCTLAAHPSR